MSQLSLFADEEVMDLVAKFINELGHTGMMDEIMRRSQTAEPYKRLIDHPLYRAADKRRRNKFWANLERAAKRVDSWPDWKKGK